MTEQSAVQKFFPQLKVYSKEELSSMDPTKLVQVFQEIEANTRSVDEKVIQLGTQIEAKETTLADIKAQVKTKFGVDTIEELQALRTKAMEEFDALHQQLSNFMA